MTTVLYPNLQLKAENESVNESANKSVFTNDVTTGTITESVNEYQVDSTDDDVRDFEVRPIHLFDTNHVLFLLGDAK